MQHVPSVRKWAPRAPSKRLAWGLLVLFMVGMGTLHFTHTPFFMRAMPPWLPLHLEAVYLSGVCEIAGGLGLLIPRLRVAAAWGLVALFIAVFPANVYVAVAGVQLTPEPIAWWIWWARLPLQAVFIAWAWWMTRDEAEDVTGAGNIAVTTRLA